MGKMNPGDTAAALLSRKNPFLSDGRIIGYYLKLVKQHQMKELSLGRFFKKFFSLDFEKEFYFSFGKIFLFWNPLWTFCVSLVHEDYNLSAVYFGWGWRFFVASVVCLLGMVCIKIFLWVERAWLARMGQSLPRHGFGWYLLFLAFLVPPGLYLALHWLVAFLNFFYGGSPIPAQFMWQYYGKEAFGVWMLLLIGFFLKSWQDLHDAARLSQIRAEELEKVRLQALLTKLKDQMNPHFLFNTLNTVASLIPEDPSKAEKVIVKLSSLYQGILAAADKTNHTLDKELQFCKDYLEIEQVRFGKRLHVSFKMDKGLDTSRILVPVLLLQPLVENAVKHGLSSRASGGHLWVGAEMAGGYLKLWVEDNGVGFGNSPYAGSGTALSNCRKRLDLAFGGKGRLEISARDGGGTRIILEFPVMSEDPISKGEA